MPQEKASHRERLSGVFAPITTPFNEEGKLLLDPLASNIRKLNESRLRGYFVLGTNGEFESLTEAERRKILETVIEVSAKDKVIMAGAGRETNEETLTHTKETRTLGFHF